ncbi:MULTISPECIES: cellulase family glycosylhydrolase [unclassified Microbulbifer]|uniref:cellulase family glycosylhydrolase n=1 Tax=unclassified Microbulbifer TaxID=2619833 RepID=UPI0027E46D26|nr:MULTISPECIES: cellulase family glycosylhydrolase [unclassified Microbulbifer]
MTNPGFENGTNGWTLNGDASAQYTESNGRNGNRLTHWSSSSSYTAETKQTLMGLAAGTYRLSAYTVGGETTQAWLWADCDGQSYSTPIPSSPWGSWSQVVVDNIQLSGGSCELGITTENSEWSSFDDVVFELVASGGDTEILLQENTAGFCGVDGSVDSNHDGFTGSGFANTDNAAGNGVDWKIEVPSSGNYTLAWRYANGGSTNRPGSVQVNGSSAATVDFPSTGAWTSWTSAGATIALSAGDNTVRLQATTSAGLGNIDSLTVTGNSPQAANCSGSNPGGLTSIELTPLMGVGWNLGNSLEAIRGETAWGNPVVTSQLINSVKAAGFNTIRIPVAWSQFSNAQNFTISSSWMNRVEEVVNYALDADMYVILNNHWDEGWMQPTYAQQDYVNNRLAIMWTQIANHFADYDHRLLFAGSNEVMVDGDYGTPTQEYYTVQNSFNQTFVDTVRATGGLNPTRYLVVQSFNTNIDHAIDFAVIPEDTVQNRLFMEVHFYDPYNFTLNANSGITQWGSGATDPSKTESWAHESYVDSQFNRMKTHFVNNGVGLILGEYGVISRPNVWDHEQYRVYWNEYVTQSSVNHQMVPVYWDNGYAGDGGMALFDRNNGNWLYSDLINAIVNVQ